MRSNEYKELHDYVMRILHEASQLSPGRVEQILREAQTSNDPELEKAVGRIAMDICYDRAYCKQLEVDYNDLFPEDVQKIKVAALYIAREDPNIVLPLL